MRTELFGENAGLRRFRPEDAAPLHEAAWDKADSYNFAIVELGRGQLAGSIWLSHVNRKHKFANLGYWVRTSCAGGGLATAAGRLIAQFGFGELGLNRLEIMVVVGNRASERVAEKLGAHREGILRQRLQLEGQAKDATMFGLLAEEFTNLNSAGA